MKKLMFILFTLCLLSGCGTVSDLPAYGSLVNGGLPGFTFNVESCTGSVARQKVNVTILISHRLAPQEITLMGGEQTFATSHLGTRFQVSYANGQSSLVVATGVQKKVTLEVWGVTPQTDAFTLVSCRIKAIDKEDASNEKVTALQFHNLPIVWQ